VDQARPVSLQAAVESLYRIAVVEGKTTSTIRLKALATYCIQELDARGLGGAEAEVPLPGGGREKQWDVAWKHGEKYRLAISMKSILSNLAGTVPNRIDDLMGETTNVQMYSPEIVVGYIMIFDVSKDQVSGKRDASWLQILSQRLARLSGRRPPSWSVGMIETSAVVTVDFSASAKLLTPVDALARFFDDLVAEVKSRNPSLAQPAADG
jgi:hypothetical protein